MKEEVEKQKTLDVEESVSTETTEKFGNDNQKNKYLSVEYTKLMILEEDKKKVASDINNAQIMVSNYDAIAGLLVHSSPTILKLGYSVIIALVQSAKNALSEYEYVSTRMPLKLAYSIHQMAF